jgi:hypothetical protein
LLNFITKSYCMFHFPDEKRDSVWHGNFAALLE